MNSTEIPTVNMLEDTVICRGCDRVIKKDQSVTCTVCRKSTMCIYCLQLVWHKLNLKNSAKHIIKENKGPCSVECILTLETNLLNNTPDKQLPTLTNINWYHEQVKDIYLKRLQNFTG
jgi:hypothetical protein